MNRKVFLARSVSGLVGCCAAAAFGSSGAEAAGQAQPPAVPDREKQFIQNWLADLMEAIDREKDEAVKVRLIGACGKACFERHEFKHSMPVAGRGDVDKLIAALKASFEAWREGQFVHVRFGAVSPGCYCPAARYRPARANDLHCNCSRGSHQAIWETELGRPVRVDILESVRRGDKTCHFLVHL
jgi:hypothetical protein